MALIKCSECGKEISDKATTCPNCGSPTVIYLKDKKTQEEKTQVVAFIAGMAVLIAFVFGYSKYEKFCKTNPGSYFWSEIKCPEPRNWWEGNAN